MSLSRQWLVPPTLVSGSHVLRAMRLIANNAQHIAAGSDTVRSTALGTEEHIPYYNTL